MPLLNMSMLYSNVNKYTNVNAVLQCQWCIVTFDQKCGENLPIMLAGSLLAGSSQIVIKH